ncbi:sigma-70 family RNA polymerase sigma factor [Tessaracoccus flavus]|uniref:RNA polymerase subunit sigma n=1 Tax=Tessaracoccus flavus TaxID=1610493 RepID=A0A1Q2CEV8_9ACTN|nr:sigma-70 family RNA polymerase sigma factor [Tessaracoccus flavus]AQP44585.1 RNA polymerase subunit sigma [Tessaracoccus flavus]SDZ09137.1 RNA polymerase sigma factor, sigma-70 family [Tessaracoccus flavus]
MNTTARIRTTDGIDGKDAVGLYLDAIAKTPLLTAIEEVELARAIEAGLYAQKVLDGEVETSADATEDELRELAAEGERSMQRFVQANLRLVVSVARKYGRAQMPLLDLVQEGNTGLIRAVEKFDYAKGFKFSTYATWWVRQAISRGIAQQGRIVRLPVHVAEQVNQVSAVRRNLERTLGRDPELSEIAEELGLEESKVVDLLRYARDHVSLDAPVEADGDTALGDLIARETSPGPDEMVLDAEERARLEGMLASLDERSQDVVRRRYGLLDGRQAKLADIGTHWGITAERVRQIERQALAQLRTSQGVAA